MKFVQWVGNEQSMMGRICETCFSLEWESKGLIADLLVKILMMKVNWLACVKQCESEGDYCLIYHNRLVVNIACS